MTRKIRNIQITVKVPKGQEAEVFQNKVNEIYCEIIYDRLKNLKMGTEMRKRIVDELIKKWKY